MLSVRPASPPPSCSCLTLILSVRRLLPVRLVVGNGAAQSAAVAARASAPATAAAASGTASASSTAKPAAAKSAEASAPSSPSAPPSSETLTQPRKENLVRFGNSSQCVTRHEGDASEVESLPFVFFYSGSLPYKSFFNCVTMFYFCSLILKTTSQSRSPPPASLRRL